VLRDVVSSCNPLGTFFTIGVEALCTYVLDICRLSKVLSSDGSCVFDRPYRPHGGATRKLCWNASEVRV
jgi:hypothetical protein